MSYEYGNGYYPSQQNQPVRVATDAMRITNLTAQVGSTEAALINLGFAEYIKGRTIRYVAPENIVLQCGLYYVNYAGDSTALALGDSFRIQPLFNESPIIGAGTVLTNTAVGISFPFQNSFFISMDRQGVLAFEQVATSAFDVLNTFQVTVIRVA